jgi:hypothetical protein
MCFVRGFLLSFGRFGSKLAVFASMVSYVLHNDKITAEEVRASSIIYFVTLCIQIKEECFLKCQNHVSQSYITLCYVHKMEIKLTDI